MITIQAVDSEIDLSASPQELSEIAKMLESIEDQTEFTVQADATIDPNPYDRALSALRVIASGGSVLAKPLEDTLLVTGSPDCLKTFASFFRFKEDAKPGTHLHHEYYEGNKGISPESVPLIIGVR